MRDTTRPTPTRPIGLIGHQGAGKDTVAGFLVKDFGYQQAAYADALRMEIYYAIHASEGTLRGLRAQESRVAFLSYLKNHKRDAPDTITGWPRMLMQAWGTMRRDLRGDDYWVRRLPIEPDMVVSDVRFVNEVHTVRAAGGVIWRIMRPGHFPGTHVSERELEDGVADAIVVNDGSIDALRTHVRATYMSMMQPNRPSQDDPLAEVLS